MWEIDDSTTIAAVGEWCLARRGVDRLLVTTQSVVDKRWIVDDPRVDTAVDDIFGGALIETFWASEWPGTKLFMRGASKIYVVRFDERVLGRMIATETRLSAWHQSHEPPLPADICLYKTGEALPVLVSVTHDWFGAWLIDETAAGAAFATPADPPLPLDMIPPPPSFVRLAR